MDIYQIADGTYYTGINDLTSSIFESLWTVDNGVTYNSYLVCGEKNALIDTVPAADISRFLTKIQDILGDKQLHYLIINHMEPDHSESIEFVKMRYPDITIIGNQNTASMISGFYNITDGIKIVNDGEEIDLGSGHILKFIFTPMLHWPETMMTYDTKTGTLFSGDAFGSFGSLNGSILDGESDIESIIPEVYRYYAAIVAKYGNFVQKALVKLKGTVINMICATHGPVWKTYILHVIDLYDRLSKFEAQNGVVIAYGSMYGNTAEIANLLARILTLKGMPVKMYNIDKTDISYALADAIKYKGILIGSPTYNNEIFPPVKTFVDALISRGFKNRVVGAFGSYSWSMGISNKILQQLSVLKNITDAGSLDMKYAQITPIENVIEEYVDNFISTIKTI